MHIKKKNTSRVEGNKQPFRSQPVDGNDSFLPNEATRRSKVKFLCWLANEALYGTARGGPHTETNLVYCEGACKHGRAVGRCTRYTYTCHTYIREHTEYYRQLMKQCAVRGEFLPHAEYILSVSKLSTLTFFICIFIVVYLAFDIHGLWAAIALVNYWRSRFRWNQSRSRRSKW